MNLTEAMSDLKAVHRQDDGSKTSALVIKLAALNVVKAARELELDRSLEQAQEYGQVFDGVLMSVL